jgi:hypothetical protein
MAKLRYTLDPYNRLVIDRTGTKSDLPKYRRVLDGQFKTGPNNALIYHIKAPLAEGEGIPHQIRLKGEWALTEGHDLRLTLDKQGRETLGDKITLKGEILDVKENSLLFAISTKTKANARLTYVLELGGAWKADKYNRLTFHVKKEKGRHDILTFKGAWEINKDHQIIYEYEKARLLRKKKKLHTLTFKGHWNVTDRSRISYEFSKRSDSAFDLKTSAGIFKGNEIKCELGIGISGRAKPVKRTVTLFGRWKVVKNLGLVFEVKYADRKPYSMVFGADACLTDKDTVSFKLRNDIENRDIGAEIELTRKILKGDGEAFVRLLKSRQETAVYVGAGFRF